ncbi:ABC transporter ATP-binding protein [Paraburkholderia sp. Cy-641]|uniref:ABC transporter ATP-binding protein n=1 Tax=Paraburkholderia sp. Cy-641 TaxID=2608337 RepID=UPI00141DAFF6|nr:ABC transporter ATP-binding protein [Paraburkholderia sp. Cy-641]NIF77765.1 ABC transporter ATP-binding protein [Paraburkholderia sp. Cy-641]
MNKIPDTMGAAGTRRARGGIELAGVSRRYGTYVAADQIDLTIGEGEFVALVGPSGCGKSTLLRMVAGLDWPDSGTIHIGGRDTATLGPSARDVAMVFQNYALYPHLTIRENIATPLALRELRVWERVPLAWRLSAASRRRRAAIDTKVREAAESLGIGALLERKPAALSGGQRQRVALGRAIVRQPAVFLYDEPLSNLDAELRASMRGEIVELHRRLGVATLYVTHDQVEAMTMADLIAVMRAGRILQLGTPAELYAQPCSIEVARTIGTPVIGLLPASVRTARQTLSAADGCILPLAVDLPEGTALTLGLRAEHLTLVEASCPGALPARVLNLEYLGADTLIHVAVDGAAGAPPARLAVRVSGMPNAHARIGETCGLQADLARAVVFDADGQRVAQTGRPAAHGMRVVHG